MCLPSVYLILSFFFCFILQQRPSFSTMIIKVSSYLNTSLWANAVSSVKYSLSCLSWDVSVLFRLRPGFLLLLLRRRKLGNICFDETSERGIILISDHRHLGKLPLSSSTLDAGMQPESEVATVIFPVYDTDKGPFCVCAVISLFRSH